MPATTPNNGGATTSLQTEFEFTLPRGYVDGDGNLHRSGVMRMATALDEIAPMRDPRVRSNQAYLVIILLSRVITRLGNLRDVNTGVVEGLFSADLAYLQEFYRRINETGSAAAEVVCPHCEGRFEIDMGSVGG